MAKHVGPICFLKKHRIDFNLSKQKKVGKSTSVGRACVVAALFAAASLFLPHYVILQTIQLKIAA